MQNLTALVLSFVAVEDAQSEYVGKLTVFGNSMAQVFVPGMSFPAYSEACGMFRAAYAEAKGASGEAAQKALERAIAKMNDFLAAKGQPTFSAPKSEAKDAKAKASQRAKAKDEAQKALGSLGITANTSSAEASAALAKAKKVSDEVRATALAFIAGKAKEEATAKKKAEASDKKDRIKAIDETLKDATIDKLEAVEKLLGIAKPSAK